MSNVKDLSIEQLMGIVNTDEKTISNLSEDRSNAVKYIREQGIKDGTTLVPNFLVYYDYCKNWRPQGIKLSKIGFLRKFSVAFESKRSKSTRYYLLDGEQFDLSQESIDTAKGFDVRARNKILKKRSHNKDIDDREKETTE